MSQATDVEIQKSSDEVLTLPEAADFLRVSEADVIELANRQELPGRKIGEQWRFLKQGLADWLGGLTQRERLLRHAGALKDDPDLESMLKRTYEERGRTTAEEPG